MASAARAKPKDPDLRPARTWQAAVLPDRAVMTPAPDALLACSPWVRLAKVQEARGLAGEWVDFDHVYTFIHRGRAEFVFDGMRVRAEPGTALVMPPGVRHVVRCQPGAALVQQIIHFDLTYHPVRAMQRRIGSVNLADPVRYPHERSALAGRLPVAVLPVAAAEECRARFADLRQAMERAGEAAGLDRQAALLRILAVVLANASGGQRPAPADRPSRAWRALDRAMGHIQASLDDPGLDIAAIARAAGLSPAYLPELFRTQLGVPVRRYLLHLRVRRARDLLAEGLSVTAVAERTGFSGIHAFSRAFRRVCGVPPSAVPPAATAPDPQQG